MEKRLIDRIEYLNVMLEKYKILNKKSGGGYQERTEAIVNQIDVLDGLINIVEHNEWNECYEMDLRDCKLDKEQIYGGFTRSSFYCKETFNTYKKV